MSQGTKGDRVGGHRQDRGRAMEQPRQIRFTADEFIAWALEQPTGRYELDNGVVVAMAPERVKPCDRQGQCFHRAQHCHRRARPCLPGAAGRHIGQGGRPDRLRARCARPLRAALARRSGRGERPGHRGRGRLPVEPGDRQRREARGYFSLPSVRHYLIVDTDQRVVIHHRRGEEGRIEARILHDGPLTLDPPGLAIDVSAIFAGV